MIATLKRFALSRRGNVAMMFALSAVPLITAVGAAVDYSRASSIRAELQADTDAVALIACRSPLTADADLKNLATAALNDYKVGYPITIASWTSANTPRSIDLTSQVSYPTRFMRIVNINSMDLTARAKCSVGETYYEMALVLDTTGSMNNSAGSGKTKIQALRDAASGFVTTMFSNFDSTHLKMSLVPFAASVKLNPTTYAPAGIPLLTATWMDVAGLSSTHWQNVLNPTTSSFVNRWDIFRKLALTQSSWSWAGCFEALPYPYNVNLDTAPTIATPSAQYVPLFAPDEIGTEQFLFGFIDTGNQDVSDPYSVNSYIDDGTSSSGACDNNTSNKSTRMGQACKYVTPKNSHSSMLGPNWGCTSRALTRLTTNGTTISNEISALTASGSTNIAEGLHWGWRTITTGVFSDATAYNTANTKKILILMTDGVNTWDADSRLYVTGSDYSAYGYFTNADGSTANTKRLKSGSTNPTDGTTARAAMDTLALETCTNMKAKGVEVWTIAFSTPGDAIDASGLTMLKSCATDESKALTATSSDTLNATFVALAKAFGAMRITK